ncbi:MAG: hypothetical protein AAGI23_16530 [Bacteroidota bacterium]
MSRLIVLFGLLLLSWSVQAQSEMTVEQEVKSIVSLYDMNVSQKYHVQKMVEMKAFNHQELKVLEADDSALYERKMLNLDRQFQLGVKSILTEEQLVKYRSIQAQKREQLTRKIEQLKASGAEKVEIAKAVEELNAIQ